MHRVGAQLGVQEGNGKGGIPGLVYRSTGALCYTEITVLSVTRALLNCRHVIYHLPTPMNLKQRQPVPCPWQ